MDNRKSKTKCLALGSIALLLQLCVLPTHFIVTVVAILCYLNSRIPKEQKTDPHQISQVLGIITVWILILALALPGYVTLLSIILCNAAATLLIVGCTQIPQEWYNRDEKPVSGQKTVQEKDWKQQDFTNTSEKLEKDGHKNGAVYIWDRGRKKWVPY